MDEGSSGSEAPQGKVERQEEEESSGCRLWCWGAGTEGQLGVGGAEDELSPRPVPLRLSSSGISDIACGGAHAIALTGDGNVLTWGRGTCGQLGQGELGNCSEPKPVKSLKCFTISHVSAGWNHSGFITDAGHLFTCGDGSFGQLGHGDCQSYFSPREVTFFASQHVMQIACGMRHSLALIKGPSGDVVFGFGSGKHGQLGISADGGSKLFHLPKEVHHFGNDSVVSICANGDNSAALTGTSYIFVYMMFYFLLLFIFIHFSISSKVDNLLANGQLYIWGRGFSACVPQIVSSLKFSQVVLGWNHALALTDHGELFMIGGYHHGMLSCSQHMRMRQKQQVSSTNASSDESSVPVLRRVPHLDGERIAHIAAGAEHSALVTESGAVMTWGWGEHGQLGLANTHDQTSPQVVGICERGSLVQNRSRVYCGSGFTFALLVLHGS